MEELGINLDIASVISDFELNIVKSVDEMLGVPVEGCFYHFSDSLKSKVQRNRFKVRYENDLRFRNFIRQCGALAHLPLSDIERGLQYIVDHFVFQDIEGNEFKEYFLNYIKEFWIDGCFPPLIWNCWGRSEDLTNNNQEGNLYS